MRSTRPPHPKPRPARDENENEMSSSKSTPTLTKTLFSSSSPQMQMQMQIQSLPEGQTNQRHSSYHKSKPPLSITTKMRPVSQLIKSTTTMSTSTPARRRRIIYDFCKITWLSYKTQSFTNAVYSIIRTRAAVVIERNWKGRYNLKLFRMFLKNRRIVNAVAIQCFWRCYKARVVLNNLRRLKIKREEDLEEQERRRFEQIKINEQRALDKIAYDLRLRELLLHKSSIKIQKNTRRKTEYNRFRMIGDSCRLIQSFIRITNEHISRRKQELLNRCAVLIQSRIRITSARSIVKKRRKALSILHRFFTLALIRVRYLANLSLEREKEAEDAEKMNGVDEDGDLESEDREALETIGLWSLPFVDDSSALVSIPEIENDENGKDASVINDNNGKSGHDNDDEKVNESPTKPNGKRDEDPALENDDDDEDAEINIKSDIKDDNEGSESKTTETEDEDQIKLDIETKEKETLLRNKMSITLQKHTRGRTTRKLQTAKKTLLRSISKSIHLRICRKAIAAKIEVRGNAVLRMQCFVRGVLACGFVEEVRERRMVRCMGEIEVMFSRDYEQRQRQMMEERENELELGIVDTNKDKKGENEEKKEDKDKEESKILPPPTKSTKSKQGQDDKFKRKWSKILPLNSSIPFGCSLFNHVDDDNGDGGSGAIGRRDIPFYTMKF